MNSGGWCVLWLYSLEFVVVGNGGCDGGVVAAGVITLLGIFNPAQCATLRRVVPGGTIPYLNPVLALRLTHITWNLAAGLPMHSYSVRQLFSLFYLHTQLMFLPVYSL